MKNVIIIIFFILCIHKTYAQCIKAQISTNPASGKAINNERPQMKNTFDWTQMMFELNSHTLVGEDWEQIISPFYQTDNSIINHLQDSKDMLPQDGWELIRKDFGYTQQGAVAYPYFILYNRFTGILRCFVAMNVTPGYNSMKFSLQFQNSLKTHTLSQIGTPLDASIEPNPQQVVATEFRNAPGKWFYADFMMNYDPCDCNAGAKLWFSVELIDNAEIKMSGIYNGKIVDIANKQGKTPKDGSLSINRLSGDTYKKAIKTYKDIDKFKKEQLKNALSESEYWEQYVNSALEDMDIGFDEIDEAMLDDFASGLDIELEVWNDYQDYKSSFNLFENALSSSKFLKGTLSVAPYIGAAFTLVDAFISGGKKSNGPQQVKLTPMSINMKAEYKGTISTGQPYTDFICYLPGTNNYLIPGNGEYPYYNNSLGVLNITETPVLNFDKFLRYPPSYTGNAYVGEFYVNMPDDIKYIINPHSGLKTNPEIMAQLIIEFDGTGKAFVQNEKKISDTLYITEIMPFDALSQKTYICPYYRTPGQTIFIENAYIKLFFNLERVDVDESTQNVLYVATYPLELVQKDKEEFLPVTNTITKYYVTLNNENITADKNAWKTVTISNSTIGGTSNQTNITAGNSVVINESTRILAKTKISGGYLPNGEKIETVTSLDISDVDCNGR